MIVGPLERVLEREVEVGERLVAAHRHAPPDTSDPDKLGTEHEDMARTADHPCPTLRGAPDGALPGAAAAAASAAAAAAGEATAEPARPR